MRARRILCDQNNEYINFGGWRLAEIAMGLFSSILKSFVSVRGRRRKRGSKRSSAAKVEGSMRPSEAEGAPKVLVASLFGSGGKEVSDRISGLLGAEGTLSTFRLSKTLKQNLRLAPLERLLLAAEEGRGWLKEETANLLIWGELEDMGTVARIRFCTLGAPEDGVPGAYGLEDTLDLSVPWAEESSDIVRAVVLAAALPVNQGPRTEMAARLKKLLASATQACAAISIETPAEYRGRTHAALGHAYATAFRFGQRKALPGALKLYEVADGLLDSGAYPGSWALLQMHWGTVLEADARSRKDVAAMDVAIKRYQSVSDTLSRDANRFDWARAQVRRAIALYKLASMVPEKTATHLKASASAFEEALTIYDRSAMPHRWAEIMSHYGVTQMALGGYGSSNAMLQQSITTFRKVLEVRKRDQQPEQWAQTMNNLGAACFGLAKRTKEEHLLEEAARCFEGAGKNYRKIPGNRKRVRVIANNLARVRAMLDQLAA